MKFTLSTLALMFGSIHLEAAHQVPSDQTSLRRKTQEYYVSFYCRLYSVPEDCVRAIIKVESNWES
jgi:hypothetical protein